MRSYPFLAALTLLVLPGSAQVMAPNPTGISMGHLHLNAKDPEIQKKFWTAVVGARPAKLGTVDVMVIPGAVIFINKAEPSGGTEGSTINHLGVKVRDMPAMVARAEAAGVRIVSRNDKQTMLMGPDDVKLELTADVTMTEAVANHHIHFYTSDVEATRKWYVDMFGAIPGKRATFEAADVPGVNLSFTLSKTPAVGTKGRSLDHIGFEVKDLAEFAKKLEAKGVKFDIPYRKVERLGISIAFFTDPWGTYIELTDGLRQIE